MCSRPSRRNMMKEQSFNKNGMVYLEPTAENLKILSGGIKRPILVNDRPYLPSQREFTVIRASLAPVPERKYTFMLRKSPNPERFSATERIKNGLNDLKVHGWKKDEGPPLVVFLPIGAEKLFGKLDPRTKDSTRKVTTFKVKQGYDNIKHLSIMVRIKNAEKLALDRKLEAPQKSNVSLVYKSCVPGDWWARRQALKTVRSPLRSLVYQASYDDVRKGLKKLGERVKLDPESALIKYSKDETLKESGESIRRLIRVYGLGLWGIIMFNYLICVSVVSIYKAFLSMLI